MTPKLVEVTWLDACETWGYADLTVPPGTSFRSVGYLVQRTPKYLTLVTHIENTTNEMHHRFDVLRSMVTKITYLGGTNDKATMAGSDAEIVGDEGRIVGEEEC